MRRLATAAALLLGAALGLAVVVVLCAACWWRAYTILRYDREQRRLLDEWWDARLRGEESCLMDDSPGVLPEKWEAHCGEVVKFPKEKARV